MALQSADLIRQHSFHLILKYCVKQFHMHTLLNSSESYLAHSWTSTEKMVMVRLYTSRNIQSSTGFTKKTQKRRKEAVSNTGFHLNSHPSVIWMVEVSRTDATVPTLLASQATVLECQTVSTTTETAASTMFSHIRQENTETHSSFSVLWG